MPIQLTLSSGKRVEELADLSPVLLAQKEAEAYLKRGRTFIYMLEKAGAIKAVTLRRPGNVSGSKFYLKSSLDAYIRSMIDEAGHSIDAAA